MGRPRIAVSIFDINLRAKSVALIPLAILAAILRMVPVAQAQTYQLIHSFSGNHGDTYEPLAGLTMDAGGNLYGTTYFGGDRGSGSGSVFKLSLKGSGWIYTPLHVFHFSSQDGANPGAQVIFGPDGSLYGTTVAGGTYGTGTVFRMRPQVRACQSALCPWNLDLLYSFDTYTAFYPNGISFDHAGNIFGTTQQGGPGWGVLYQLTSSNGSWTFNVLHSFTDSYDAGPYAAPILDGYGNIYGTLWHGAYGFTTSGQFQELHQFTNNDGWETSSALILDKAGNLYGTTLEGVPSGSGSVFELSPSNGGWTLTTLYSFTGSGNCDGVLSNSSLAMDAAGNLYGTTDCAGAYGWGNVFKLSPSNGSWTYTSLHDFCPGGYPCADGSRPWSNIVFDSKGNLYGTVSEGVNPHDPLEGGGVWEITP
jgi:uncharacterized repeat protein (TIGR03803 family)